MPERNFRTRVDRWLRREDTFLAKSLRTISPKTGAEYRRSTAKRVSEYVIIAPIAPIAAAAVGVLAALAKAEDRGPAFYKQKRLGKDGNVFDLIKIRCMKTGADQEPWSITHERNAREADDHRNTRIGKVMRAVEAEELPQLAQVLTGDMSLVDVRAIAPYARDYMQEELNEKKFARWDQARAEGKPGLFSLNSAMNNERKNDLKRDHYDRLYARKASLGLDLFVLYRMGLRMSEKVYKKASGLFQDSGDVNVPEIGTISVPELIRIPMQTDVQVFPDRKSVV